MKNTSKVDLNLLWNMLEKKDKEKYMYMYIHGISCKMCHAIQLMS